MKNQMQKYSPLSILDAQDEFLTPLSKIFDRFFDSTCPEFKEAFGSEFMTNGSFPKVNVIEQENRFIIEAGVAGFNKNEVTVEVKNGILVLRGQRQSDMKFEKGCYIFNELKQSGFSRSFSLNGNFDEDKIEAELNNGVLKLIIPKKEPTPVNPSKKIEIK